MSTCEKPSLNMKPKNKMENIVLMTQWFKYVI